MPQFIVTTAQTVYEAYTVTAPDAASAQRLISQSNARAHFESAPAGGNDDEHVIDVKEVEAE
jgi:hypothetical protein